MIDKNLSYAYSFAEGGEVSPRALFTTKVRPDVRKLRSLRGARPRVPRSDEEYAFFNNLYGPAGGTSPDPVPPQIAAPKGYKFVSTVETPDGGLAKAFQKIGDETGFTIYQREITSGPNSGKQGYYFDDIGEKVGSAGTGGYLKADDAFNQGRTRSSNYVHAANDLIERGVELSDSFLQKLNAALQHHDKYLGGNDSVPASRREGIVNAMKDVLGYEKYTGGQYVVDNQGLKAAEPMAPPPQVIPIEPGGDFGLSPIEPGGDFGLPPILYLGPDGQPVYGGIFPDQPVVSPPPIVQPVFAPPPQVLPIDPVLDYGGIFP
jgi:hypothetical protein